MADLLELNEAAGWWNTQQPLTHPVRPNRTEGSMQPTQSTERWLPIPGYEGRYEVSDLGRVRSLDVSYIGPRGAMQTARGRLRKLSDDSRGYPTLRLYRGNIGVNAKVHRLVMQAFVGPCPEGMEVRHLNGDSSDSRLENLTYGTHSENVQDTIRHGNHHALNKTHCKYGHEYTPENTITWPSQSARRCRTCRLRECRRYRARNIGTAS